MVVANNLLCRAHPCRVLRSGYGSYEVWRGDKELVHIICDCDGIYGVIFLKASGDSGRVFHRKTWAGARRIALAHCSKLIEQGRLS